ncbi:MAG: hypothetical protein UY39_C0054G0003 [Candidatus Kaiserbacteria bacterium GW2011_GWC2_49_12]|uniref:Uncharacterized protein n=2 Tax=Candidatus Kaiseribacteriota TaxID=1752734 RepID=A0A0G1WH28_9BACT|nr:MAG: hypothetical protein UY39_C0054G0003 [Candidatus Kaiserbacteria bacterium GW2011_GWC2_49_12]KKW17945.1 MAG: hypothetical protein UY59_C0020G0004 [Candidatus Kaiserbacteria bacterium GW2011_GWA1_50_28]
MKYRTQDALKGGFVLCYSFRMSEETSPEQMSRVNKLRTVSREASMFLKGGVQINDVLWYHVSREYPGQIGIHLFPTKIEQSVTGAKDFMSTFEQGLKELARRIKTDSQFADITHVSAWSRIVYDRSKLLQLMGFELGERDEEKKEALARMTREKFLEKYGGNK